MEGNKLYWRSGPWNGYLFLGVPYLYSEVSSGFNVDNHNDSVEISYELADQARLERYVLTYDGIMVKKFWNDSRSSWQIEWQSLGSECDVYGKFGAFAVCDPRKEPICECLKGFKQKNVDEWSKGNWSNGCVRRTELQCHAPGSKADKFFATEADQSIGCMLWSVSLIDLHQYSADGADLFIRLADSELPGERNRRKIVIIVTMILSAFVSVISVYYMWKWMGHKYGKKAATPPTETQWQTVFGAPSCSNDFQDLPLFEFRKLADATNGFSEINKLGRGGFGSVYKGKWEDGQEIAVKRLSRASGQGLQEFMNEVNVISKLQHKNLVRLLGCCVEGEEKLLVYELMPNKSLDAMLFDPQNCKLLDWRARFSIIQGICRGLLYLHRDSRLRIIHRDLKPSNILLDEDLNPKISDFGMAKFFGSKQDQATTLRVVGTGYMSPEYAMEGRFSEKSDVYSFGVLLLEIVSGKKIKLRDSASLNLLSYAWKLWNDNDIGSLIDPTVRNPCFEVQISKFIQVGLLCVQELPADRPDVSTVISMLDVDDVDTLPNQKQPGFTRSRSGSGDGIQQNGHEHCSVNGVSVTTFSGR
ncbi:hypothetical protein RND81_06G120600 [Saponaria officinalis]|uniref:non-specific serine/threonine protein kinase n=1 Tax=Saponaria officinalis TaxID=3572 RepID=A0AAW1KAZ1_SAPOF